MYKFSLFALVAFTGVITAAVPAAVGNPDSSAAAAAEDQASPPAPAADVPVSDPAASSAASSLASEGFPVECTQQLATQKVTVIKPVENNGIRLDGVPSACMDVARDAMNSRIELDGPRAPAPDVIDADSIQYNDLSDADYVFLSDMFNRWTAGQSDLMKRHFESRDNV